VEEGARGEQRVDTESPQRATGLPLVPSFSATEGVEVFVATGEEGGGDSGGGGEGEGRGVHQCRSLLVGHFRWLPSGELKRLLSSTKVFGSV